jgi:hypothetical protein
MGIWWEHPKKNGRRKKGTATAAERGAVEVSRKELDPDCADEI